MARRPKGGGDELALREHLHRLASWQEHGDVKVEHNNEAKYVVADDGSKWVMKKVSITGPNQFLAEAISYQLAHLLGLSVPTGGVGGSGEGLAWFSSLQPTVAHYSPARLPMTSQQADFGRIVALDVWVINEDRHAGNVLLVSGDTSFTPCFIDFGSAMVGHPADYVKRINYVPREAEFVARTVAPELLWRGAQEAADAIDRLHEDDVRGVVVEACALVGFETDAAPLSEAVLARRVVLRELIRAFFARLGVTP